MRNAGARKDRRDNLFKSSRQCRGVNRLRTTALGDGDGIVAVVISHDGNTVYAVGLDWSDASKTAAGYLVAISTSTYTVMHRVALPGLPSAVAEDPDDGFVYVVSHQCDGNACAQWVSVAEALAFIPMRLGGGSIAFADIDGPRRSTHCTGDCNRDGVVTSDEVLQSARAASTRSYDSCGADVDANGEIATDELIRVVTSALNGCAAAPPSPTATPVPSTAAASAVPTATPTFPMLRRSRLCGRNGPRLRCFDAPSHTRSHGQLPSILVDRR